MPLYDCMLMMKPKVNKEAMIDLVTRIARRVYQRNGVVTDVKSFGTVQLGYGIKKKGDRDRETDPDRAGQVVRYYQGQLMQMTMMVPPSFNKELHYLQKEDRLLRCLVVKHRGVRYGLEYLNDNEIWGRDRPSAEISDDSDEDVDDDGENEAEDDGNENNGYKGIPRFVW